MRAIYFAKDTVGKYPNETFQNGILWREPYVVMDKIMKRLIKHKFMKSNADKLIPDQIKDVIAPDLKLPAGRGDDILGGISSG